MQQQVAEILAKFSACSLLSLLYSLLCSGTVLAISGPLKLLSGRFKNMKCKIALVLIFALISLNGMAFEHSKFVGCLKDLSEGIAQTAYSISEKAQSNERVAYEEAANRADASEKELAELIQQIDSKQDIELARKVLLSFAVESKANEHTAAFADKLLQQRAVFLNASKNSDDDLELPGEFQAAVAPEMLLNSRQRRLIMIDTPIAEAVISLEDTKQNRRLDNLKEIFKRHECRILSENQEDGGDLLINNFYFSGKKFVVDAVLGHFGGDLVNSNLKAVVKITTGGFWSGKKTVEFKVAPKRSGSVMGDLSWYKAAIEKNPFKYFANNGEMNKLAQLGSYENIAGEQKLQLKNAVVEIWVTGSQGSLRNAIYKNSIDFGDVYVDVQ
jgi:hypothetical protein